MTAIVARLSPVKGNVPDPLDGVPSALAPVPGGVNWPDEPGPQLALWPQVDEFANAAEHATSAPMAVTKKASIRFTSNPPDSCGLTPRRWIFPLERTANPFQRCRAPRSVEVTSRRIASACR